MNNIGTSIGISDNDNPPKITQSNPTLDEALRSCMYKFYADINKITVDYVKECDLIKERYKDDS